MNVRIIVASTSSATDQALAAEARRQEATIIPVNRHERAEGLDNSASSASV